MENKNYDVCKAYEKIADWYDKHRSTNLFEKVWLDKATILLPEASQILDLGCGTGTPIVPYFLEKGFSVTGVDGSTKLISIAKSRYPEANFFIKDMISLKLNQKFNLILAWNSFFHLEKEKQRMMFKTFASHLKMGGVLLFTSGPKAGEAWGDKGGESIYHASLSSDEYEKLLIQHGFTLIESKISDPQCHGTTVWLAKLEKYIE